jgi:glyoxylase-like metal-dependent hydrolase (beta-lactamase superfamily II)
MLPFPVVNAYLLRVDAGFGLIDTGPRGCEADVLDALDRVGGVPAELRHIVLTHSHKDHAGSAAALVALTGAMVHAGAKDAPVVAGEIDEPEAVITEEERPFYDAIAPTIPPAPAVRVDRVLYERDRVDWGKPSALVLDAPGHTPGSIALYLPDSRVLFAGDNIASVNGRPILGPFNVDRAEAIASFRKLASHDVDIVCFGHGDPIESNVAEVLRTSASRL